MLSSTEQIIENGLSNHVIRDADLQYLFKGSPARRYALVNKALKKGELIRICRGFYTLANKYQTHLLSRYYIANRIVAHSFISAESALSLHGWIPERVIEITSITALGRNRAFTTPLGLFTYRTLPIAARYFYYGVNLIKIDKQTVYAATPLRALMDYIYWHKVKNANLDFLKHSLRIEMDNIKKISHHEIEQLKPIYQASTVCQFLQNLLDEKKDG